jgi:hypothetical protein
MSAEGIDAAHGMTEPAFALPLARPSKTVTGLSAILAGVSVREMFAELSLTVPPTPRPSMVLVRDTTRTI